MREEGNTEGALFSNPQYGGKTKRRRKIRMVNAFQQVLPKEKVNTQRNFIFLISIVTRKVIHHINGEEGVLLVVVNLINLGMNLSFTRTMIRNNKKRLKFLIVRRKINSLLLHFFQEDH